MGVVRGASLPDGYLTVADEKRAGFRTFHCLDYPNLEVRVSLNDELLGHLGNPGRKLLGQGRAICARFLRRTNSFAFAIRLRAYLLGIP